MGYPHYEDLTPGNPRGDMEVVDVKTDSLHTFGTGLAMQAETEFGVLSLTHSSMVITDAVREPGSRSIGNTELLHELHSAGNYAGTAAEKGQQLAIDLKYGCVALGNGAAWAAEQAGMMDGFNGASLSTLRSAFDPPADAELQTMQQRQQMLDRSASLIDRSSLPIVHPSDVHLYNMAGVDPDSYQVVDTSDPLLPTGTEDGGGNGNDPTSGNQDNGSGPENNDPFLEPVEEDDYDEERAPVWMPPDQVAPKDGGLW